MVDTHLGRPSLLLARHDRAHREHLHQHHLFHRGDSAVVQSIVTEIVATVSVIQQVTVDSTGNTIGLYTFTADSTGGTSYPPTISENSSPSTTAASPGTSSPDFTASSTGAGDQLANNAALSSSSSSQSLLSIQNVESASTATPVSSIPTTFASLLTSPNSTTLISTSNTLTPSFSNSSISLSTSSASSSSSLFANLLSSSTTSPDGSSTTSPSSTSSFYSPTSSSSQLASTTVDNSVGGAGVGSGSTSTSTAAAGSGGESNASSTPSTSTVVGGVVGGVAGAAILIFLLMFLIRWKRRNQSMLALGSGEPEGSAGTTRALPPSQPPGGMAERSSFGGFAVPAALASLTGYKRSSQRTADRTTISSTAGSERGFYRVSGRKLPSVLQSGGDGYGGGIMESNTLSGSSFYRDSQGFYGGPSSPPAGISIQRDSGVPVMREGPARTPVTEQGPFAAAPEPLTPPSRRPDVLGRSHPSMDGSQRSRFTEEV